MAKLFNITIAHELGQAEAERRIRAGVDSFKTKFGTMAQVTHEQWKDGTLDFEMDSMHQRCKGKVAVLEDSVVMELMLPALLAMMAGKIRDAVTRKGKLLLDDKRI